MIPLVLLPGMMCDARLFAPQMGALSGSRAVHCAPIAACDTVEAMAADVLLNAPPEFALAGLSMGGIVAMEIYRQAPDRVAGLALLDTNPNAEIDRVRDGREPQIAKVQAGELTAVMRDEMKPNYLKGGPNRSGILDLCMAMAEALGSEVFVNQSRALQSRPDQTTTLRDVTCPTLILCGRDDVLCPVARHEQMYALVAGSRLVIVDDAGHLPTLERPEQTNSALLQWLAMLDD